MIGNFPAGSRDDHHALALDATGRVWAWGKDGVVLGRVATSTVPASQPAPVDGLSQVAAISSGPSCGYALRQDGTVWTWGSNEFNGLGNGSHISAAPVQVVGFGGASQTLSTLGTGSEGDSWFLENFSASELLSSSLVADEGDPDGDGIANLMEYALGLDPRQRGLGGLPVARVDLVAPQAQSEDAALSQIALFSTPTADLASGKRYMALTVNRNGGIRQDVDYIIEVSQDLATWHSGDPHTIEVLDTAEVLEAYCATALEDAPRQFMRLRVQRREGFFCP
jgi:hypothetical protein